MPVSVARKRAGQTVVVQSLLQTMACQYCAVLNFAELETQIQKESQPWMAALNVRDTFFMERAYLYLQGFHFWNMTKQNMCFPGRECHTPLADSSETISIHPSLHLLTFCQQSHFLQIFWLEENPLKLQGSCNSHVGSTL